MQTNLVLSYLNSIVQSHGNLRLTEAEPLLCDGLGAVEVKFLDDDDHQLHGRTLLKNATQQAQYVTICFEYQGPTSTPPDNASAPPSTPQVRSPKEGNAEFDGSDDAPKRFIRELHRLQANREFMWAGFVVKELLPQMGFVGPEARQFLSELEADGIVMITKEPNPNNPDHPTACVRLNADHPQVKAALERSSGERTRIRVRGEPVSQTLIRERR